MYEALFQPMKIGELEIKKRFVMPAMNSHYADAKASYDGTGLQLLWRAGTGGIWAADHGIFYVSVKKDWLIPCRQLFMMMNLFLHFPD